MDDMASILIEPTAPSPKSEIRTVADLLRRLGDIPAERVRVQPAPGTATIADVETNKLCELIDGTLVEKAMGARQALVGAWLIHLLTEFAHPRNLGIILGADGTLEILTGLVRLPDVAFLSWDRLPGRRVPEEAVPAVVPDLAVEVLSQSNTPAEMLRKRQEYFTAGVRLVWMIDPAARVVTVYTAVNQSRVLSEADTLDGGTVLPGFTVPVRDLFAELDRHG
jgi:Uma2 family endonuclease